MTLRFNYHPLSSYCWKGLIALYELEIPFTPVVLDITDPDSNAAFEKLWPMGSMPVLEDETRGTVTPESSIIIEYLDRHYSGKNRLIPADPDLALETRLTDRFFDLHIHAHMQKIVLDNIRPDGQRDPFGVAQSREKMARAYGVVENLMSARQWANGGDFSLADCAASPALHYANRIAPLDAFPHARAYLARLEARPAFARVLREAEPFFRYFPG